MTMYNEPEFKVVIAKTEDVLTASPVVEGAGNGVYETDIMPLYVGING